MDALSIRERSLNMGRIKSKNTQPEIKIRSVLSSLGYRYKVNCEILPGKPDIVFSKFHKVIFVHGCFWHGHNNCNRSARPNTNKDFWDRKLDANILRDKKNIQSLIISGWEVLVIWQCQLKDEILLKNKIYTFLTTEKKHNEKE
jgi:DNA mismatch endonuclease, patch repair protein